MRPDWEPYFRIGNHIITTSIKEASTEVDNTRQAKRVSIQGQMGTKEYDKMVRKQCKPIQYSNKILEHLPPLWELGLNNWNNLITIQHHTEEHYTLHISPTNVLMARLPNGDKTSPKTALRNLSRHPKSHTTSTNQHRAQKTTQRHHNPAHHHTHLLDKVHRA